MKKIIALSLSILIFFTSQAQFKTIAEGPAFEEPEDGFAKILQMKNGNTMFFHITFKKGIMVKIYNAAHKQKAENGFEPAYGKLRGGNIDGIFEINGDAILLISEVDGKTPVLYRLIVDGNNGKLKEEKKIAELMRMTMGQGYAAVFGGVPLPDFCIRKDPNSENYALAMFNSFASDRNRRIEIVFFGSDNKEISRAYYSSPKNKYKFLEYIDMAVIGSSKVCVLAHAYNTEASGGKESELIMANLDAGSKEVTLQELNYTKDLKITGGITRYNPVTKKLILLSAAKVSKKDKGNTISIAYLDPETKKLERTFDIYPVHANEKSLELFGKKHEYKGMPQNLYINSDGSFSVVYEEIENHTNYGNGHADRWSELGNIAVSLFDKTGKETNSYLIPKSHFVFDLHTPSFYQSEREGTAQNLFEGNQFKSFAYLNGNKNIYVLFNDIEKNGESVQKGKMTTIKGVSDCDGFYYVAGGKETMPTRKFVFGKPDSKRENNLALFPISDYNRDTNLYVTLKLEKEGRSKEVKVVWLQPE